MKIATSVPRARNVEGGSTTPLPPSSLTPLDRGNAEGATGDPRTAIVVDRAPKGSFIPIPRGRARAHDVKA